MMHKLLRKMPSFKMMSCNKIKFKSSFKTAEVSSAKIMAIKNKDDFQNMFESSDVPIILSDDLNKKHTLQPSLKVDPDAVALFVNEYAPNLLLSDILLADMDEYSRYFFVYDLMREATQLSTMSLSIIATPNAMNKLAALRSAQTESDTDAIRKLDDSNISKQQESAEKMQFNHPEHFNQVLAPKVFAPGLAYSDKHPVFSGIPIPGDQIPPNTAPCRDEVAPSQVTPFQEKMLAGDMLLPLTAKDLSPAPYDPLDSDASESKVEDPIGKAEPQTKVDSEMCWPRSDPDVAERLPSDVDLENPPLTDTFPEKEAQVIRKGSGVDKSRASTLMSEDVATNDVLNSAADEHKMNVLVLDKSPADIRELAAPGQHSGRVQVLVEIRKHIAALTHTNEAVRYQFLAQLVAMLQLSSGDLAPQKSIYGVLTDGDEFQIYRVSRQLTSLFGDDAKNMLVVEHAEPVTLLDRNMQLDMQGLGVLLSHLCTALQVHPAQNRVSAKYVTSQFANEAASSAPSMSEGGSAPAEEKGPTKSSPVRNDPPETRGSVQHSSGGGGLGAVDTFGDGLTPATRQPPPPLMTQQRRSDSSKDTSTTATATVVDPSTAAAAAAAAAIDEVPITVKTLQAELRVQDEYLRGHAEELWRVRGLLYKELLMNGETDEKVLCEQLGMSECEQLGMSDSELQQLKLVSDTLAAGGE